MAKAIDELWGYTSEIFFPLKYELQMLTIGIGTDVTLLKEEWMQNVKEIFSEAGLTIPELISTYWGKGRKT